ncbi:MAG TPA: tRNA lysidine(34) synthetase TilS [Terriglobales bacterium]|nr:tRNA lysidine(34) synthetase TilS [Terriglobales bacterium]
MGTDAFVRPASASSPLYHVAVHSLAERVLGHIRRQELLKAGDRVGVAVSGGIDSVTLLRLLLELRGELGIVLSVVHFNHKLRGAESDGDQEFVAGLAREYDLEFHADTDDVAQQAASEHVSVETAARELRYGFFRYLLGGEGEECPSGAEAPVQGGEDNRSAESAAPPKSKTGLSNSILDKIVTGHTLDDQAETVLMRMIRGSGLRGLGGIYPRIAVEDDDGDVCGEIVRPLLAVRRCEVEQYLKDLGQTWCEDSTNSDDGFTRNRVRKLVVPLLEKEFNPAVAESLAELAEIARGEEDYWENEVAGWMGTAVHWSEPEWARALSKTAGLVQISSAGTGQSQNPHFSQNRGEVGHPGLDDLRSLIDNAAWLVMNATVDRLWFLGEPLAVQRRLVKAIGEQAGLGLEFRHVEEILRFAADEHSFGKELSLPLGWKVERHPEELVFLTPDLRQPAPARDYEYDLPVPGRVTIHETGSVIAASLLPGSVIPGNDAAGYNPEHLLDAETLPGPLRVRNWRPGDRFWPAHTKSPKKIKELLQERHASQPERRVWPVVVSRNESGDEIVWLRGFPLPARLRAKAGRRAILITETRVTEELITEKATREPPST